MALSFVVEHMEDDDQATKSVPPWVLLEYKHMTTLAGSGNTVRFTHLSLSSCAALQALWVSNKDDATQSNSGASVKTTTSGILGVMKQENVSLSSVCLLDPKAELPLTPEDGDGRFKWFLFGGILGDDPPRDRTSELRVLGFPTRHLGTVQMTTDTAVGVTKAVVVDKTPLNEIPYIDYPTIRFNVQESVEMPFRYIKTTHGEPVLPDGMRDLLKADLDKGFDIEE